MKFINFIIKYYTKLKCYFFRINLFYKILIKQQNASVPLSSLEITLIVILLLYIIFIKVKYFKHGDLYRRFFYTYGIFKYAFL